MTVARNRLIAKWVLAALFAGAVWLVVSFMTGCSSTVRPASVSSSTIAFDEGEQNAGVLITWPGKGALITDHKKAEYDALVRLYGRGTVGHRLTPPVVRGRGLTQLRGQDEGFPLHDVVWKIDAQALTDFLLFKDWQRRGRTPL